MRSATKSSFWQCFWQRPAGIFLTAKLTCMVTRPQNQASGILAACSSKYLWWSFNPRCFGPSVQRTNMANNIWSHSKTKWCITKLITKDLHLAAGREKHWSNRFIRITKLPRETNFIFFSLPFITVTADHTGKNKSGLSHLLIIAGFADQPDTEVLINVDPELIFLIFLPPLLYEAAVPFHWKRSCREVAAHHYQLCLCGGFLPRFLWPLRPAVLLAQFFCSAELYRHPIPWSASLKQWMRLNAMRSILGEKPAEWPSSLIIFPVCTGVSSCGKICMVPGCRQFFWMVIGGVAAGWVVGKIFMWIRNKLPTDPDIDIVITLVTPMWCTWWQKKYTAPVCWLLLRAGYCVQ